MSSIQEHRAVVDLPNSLIRSNAGVSAAGGCDWRRSSAVPPLHLGRMEEGMGWHHWGGDSDAPTTGSAMP